MEIFEMEAMQLVSRNLLSFIPCEGFIFQESIWLRRFFRQLKRFVSDDHGVFTLLVIQPLQIVG